MAGCLVTRCTDSSAGFATCRTGSVERDKHKRLITLCFILEEKENPLKLQIKKKKCRLVSIHHSLTGCVCVLVQCTNLLVLQESLTHAGAEIQLSLQLADLILPGTRAFSKGQL